MSNLDDIINWIEKNLDKNITTTDVVIKSGYSSRYLYSIFKKKSGVSLYNYLRLRKLTLASYMLRRSNIKITDIVFMYGFDSIQHFSRVFKNHFGLSPREYRKAQYWDMRLFFPSAIVSEFNYIQTIIYISELYLTPYHKDTINISYGFNFLPSIENGKILTTQELEKHYIDLFEVIAKHRNKFTIMGDIILSSKSDSIISTSVGDLTFIANKKTIEIPTSKYICFHYRGSLNDIFKFHTWATGHGLHKHKCTLLKGPTFTSFTKSTKTNTFKIKYYIPIN
ncbi:AraC family transcriptional regulator [Salmonella enterica subsp. enterica serovar Thompson]|nr:AraC family transcriptional regulator [Salmonella enterica subsp. enterica]EBH8640836.1 AraC family transcriptional regulator [Salmonella enterica subsp. enterica serovar Thompson]EBR2768113.1 AraC family transcriptional regulator [Salmonella enterica]EED9463093.1 AraC family transcriptional regulator [Salmonella enterica subsp. enterica serovar Abaetetuba]EBT4148421.1 AraC family transcriptional regulator [Salmonella enterica subsp. enterica]